MSRTHPGGENSSERGDVRVHGASDHGQTFVRAVFLGVLQSQQFVLLERDGSQILKKLGL